MEKLALAQEKVWLDKPSYDKAEQLYFERLAKVVSPKIMESCTLMSEISLTNYCKHNLIVNSNSSTKIKSEKSKDNKSLNSENILNETKNNKCQTKLSKTNKGEHEKKENVEEKQKSDNVKNDQKEEHKETNLLNDVPKKYNTKEVKEKKNKADTRHKNRKGTNDADEVTRNKQQLPLQDQFAATILCASGSLADEVAKARQHIKQSLQCMDDIAVVAGLPTPTENKDNKYFKDIQELKNTVDQLSARMKALEETIQPLLSVKPTLVTCPAKPEPAAKKQKTDDDDDVDLFDSDSEGEDADAAKLREERLAAYAAKKAKKPALIAKSNIILDVKPWDDETDMKAMEKEVRSIQADGLLWGASKLVPLAFGIHKLQISCVVEDDKISVDWLTEKIQDNEDFVQSVDIAAFNKV